MVCDKMKHISGLGLCLLFGISLSSATSLYSADDPLWELDASNFEGLVIGQNKAWIVEFYNSWCGHCIRFAPTWKLFASDTKMWRKVIDVGAINCNDAANVKLCRQYDVQSYPTIKLFWHNINESEMGEPLEGNRDILSMEEYAIKFLESNWDKGVPPNWPDLTTLDYTSVKEVVKSVHMKGEGLYLFVEEADSLVGRQIILDLSFQTSVIIRRVWNTNTDLLNDLGPGLYNGTVPVLIKLDQSGKGEVLLRFPHNATSIEIRDQLFEFIVGHRRSSISRNESKEMLSSKTSVTDSVYMVDLENAVYYSLSQEVGVTKVIEGEKFSALKAFLSVLKSYFPGSPPIIAYLSNLYNWVSYKKRFLTGEEFVQNMENLQNDKEYLPKLREWTGCKGSQSKFRGYPCSLWTLFHTLTVQANNEFKESHGNSETAAEALFVIRDYIKYFFTCHECVENFGHMAVNLENEVNSSQNAVLWLWDAHNKANRRLAGDLTEDPKHPKVQFPPPELCPRCRTSGNTFDDTVWDRTNVLEFLHHFYGKKNIRNVNSLKVEDSYSADQSLNNSNMVNTFKNNSVLETWNFKWFTSADISLCVSLYLISAILLILLFFIFQQRRRRRKFQFRKYLHLNP